MYSPKEKEIIERCLSISAWNYRASKFEIAGKETEANVLRGKVRGELLILEKLVDESILAKISVSPPPPKQNNRKISRFFGRFIGRDLQ